MSPKHEMDCSRSEGFGHNKRTEGYVESDELFVENDPLKTLSHITHVPLSVVRPLVGGMRPKICRCLSKEKERRDTSFSLEFLNMKIFSAWIV